MQSKAFVYTYIKTFDVIQGAAPKRVIQEQTLLLPISLDPSRATGAGQVGNNLTAPLSQRDPWVRLFGTRDPERQQQAGGKRNKEPPSSFGDAATCGKPCAVGGPPISVRHYLCRVGRPERSRGLPSHAIFLERDSISGLPAMTPHPFSLTAAAPKELQCQ